MPTPGWVVWPAGRPKFRAFARALKFRVFAPDFAEFRARSPKSIFRCARAHGPCFSRRTAPEGHMWHSPRPSRSSTAPALPRPTRPAHIPARAALVAYARTKKGKAVAISRCLLGGEGGSGDFARLLPPKSFAIILSFAGLLEKSPKFRLPYYPPRSMRPSRLAAQPSLTARARGLEVRTL